MPMNYAGSASSSSRKLEFDYHRYEIGCAYQSKVNVPNNWVPVTVNDAKTYFGSITALKGIQSSDPLYPPPIAKADFYTWSLSEIPITFDGVAYKGYLIILYDDYNGAIYETAAPFRAEFSWRAEAPAGSSGTQMSYDVTRSKKMIRLLNAITASSTWFFESPKVLGDYVY